MQSLLSHVLDALFPPRCVCCETVLVASDPHPVCPDCALAIRWINGPVGSPDIPSGLFAHLAACCTFSGPIIDALHRFKYERRTDLARPLGALLAGACGAYPADGVIIPVPLSRRRLRDRGYNQAQLLARQLRRLHPMTVAPHALRRHRDTRPQVGQERDARLANVRGAFVVPDRAAVRDRHVIVLDDVMTTGATLTACAKVLRHAGAASVSALVVAVV